MAGNLANGAVLSISSVADPHLTRQEEGIPQAPIFANWCRLSVQGYARGGVLPFWRVRMGLAVAQSSGEADGGVPVSPLRAICDFPDPGARGHPARADPQ